MAYTDLIEVAKEHFPKLQIKYKNESTLMHIIGKLLIFNPYFMTNFLTTIGHTIYVPSEQWLQDNIDEVAPVIIHECVHIYDEDRYGMFYNLAYLLPQILVLPAISLFFLISWKLALFIVLFFLLPLPAPFRAFFEKKAYFVQVYAATKFRLEAKSYATYFAKDFKNSSYYFMWPFEQDSTWLEEVENIVVGKPSWASDMVLYKLVNDLITASLK